VHREDNDDEQRNYPVKTNSSESKMVLSNRNILADITFAAEQQSAFYLTVEFNIVRQMNNRMYSIGKLKATDNGTYPFIITDEAGTKLWVDNRGNILNGNSRNVEFLKVRK